MRRIFLALATLGILGFAASGAQAHEYHQYHHGHWPYGVYYGAPVVYPQVVVQPPYVTPVPIFPTAVCPRVYNYPYYAPAAGFYYRGTGLSIGVGF